MSVLDALSVLSKLGLRSKVHDDDYIDQLSHFLTPSLLLLAASATYLKQWLGDPIHCWVPAQYKDDHFQSYVDNFCFITDLYNVPMVGALPNADEDRHLVGFYRWVSILLLFQALMFKFPNLVWMSWKSFSGLDPDKIMKMVEEIEIGKGMEEFKDKQPIKPTTEQNGVHDIGFIDDMEPKKRRRIQKDKGNKDEHRMTSIARFIDRRLEQSSRRANQCGPFRRLNCMKNSGNFVSVLFCFNKLLYITVILAQFFILSSFLDMNFFSYGVKVSQFVTEWKDWEDMDIFPRIAWCDFEIRQLQNVLPFTVQCVLPMNIFIEKIYALQWFWFIFLLIFTIFGVIKAIKQRLSFGPRYEFVQKFFTIGFNGYMWPLPKSSETLGDEVTPREIIQHLPESEIKRVIKLVQEKSFIKSFVTDYLKADGVFILAKLHESSSPTATVDILFRLLEYYLVSKGHVTVDYVC